MGGNALLIKGVETRRYLTDEYNQLKEEVLGLYKEKYPNHDFYIIKAYNGKESHGDMDILMKINDSDNRLDIMENTVQIFKPKAVHKNDNVFSFEYKDFQIDLIMVDESYYDFQKDFMDFDPSGNLCGKIAHKFGMKYSVKGLFFILRSFNGRVSKDILLTRDHDLALTFLGFDVERYKRGFDSLQEIFDFVIESKYFNFEFYRFENLTQKDRKRNRKRSTYNEFVTYCNNILDTEYDLNQDRSEVYESKNYQNKFEFNRDKSVYIDMINDYFPEVNLLDKIDEYEARFKKFEECSSKFNGKIIMKMYPNLKGKELSSLIIYIKEYYELDDNDIFAEKIYPMSEDDIINMISERYNEWSQKKEN